MRAAACVSLLLAACAGERATSGIGHLDARFVETASTREGMWRTKVHVGKDGAVRKLSAYHKERAAIPEPVLALAEQRFPGGQVGSYETEVYLDDGWVYEVEVTSADGRNCEISSDAAGTLRYIECRLAVEEVPAAIAEQVATLVPGGSIVEAERKEYADGTQDTRVESKVGDLVHYLVFGQGGELLERQIRVPSVLIIRTQ